MFQWNELYMFPGLGKTLLWDLYFFNKHKYSHKIWLSFDLNDPKGTFWFSKWAQTPSEDLELLSS